MVINDEKLSDVREDSLELLVAIVQEFSNGGFSLEDVSDSFNDQTSGMGIEDPDVIPRDYGIEHLDYLVKGKYVTEIEGLYYVNPHHKKVMELLNEYGHSIPVDEFLGLSKPYIRDGEVMDDDSELVDED